MAWNLLASRRQMHLVESRSVSIELKKDKKQEFLLSFPTACAKTFSSPASKHVCSFLSAREKKSLTLPNKWCSALPCFSLLSLEVGRPWAKRWLCRWCPASALARHGAAWIGRVQHRGQLAAGAQTWGSLLLLWWLTASWQLLCPAF